MPKIKKLQDVKNDLRTAFGFTKVARQKYVDPLIENTHSPFKVSNAPMKEVFVSAVALGYYNGYRVPLEGDMDRNIRSGVFSLNDVSLFLTIAVTENDDFNIIADGMEVSTIVEEYANGGIQALYKMVFEVNGDPVYTFREKFNKLLNKYKGEENN